MKIMNIIRYKVNEVDEVNEDDEDNEYNEDIENNENIEDNEDNAKNGQNEGLPSTEHSQVVRRAPWSYGRVSSAYLQFTVKS